VGRAVNAALDPSADPVKAANLALKLVLESDPPAQAAVEISGELTPDAVENLSLAQLIAVAERLELTS